MNVRVEPLAGPADLDAIVAIEDATFNNPAGRAWYEAELARPDVCRIFVLRTDAGSVIAFVAYWQVVDEMHINNLAVDPAWRGRGFGRLLLRAVLDVARGEGVQRATLEVRRSNQPALRLYAGAGFAEAGVRARYYTHPEEDALLLALRLNPPEEGGRVRP